MHLCALYGEQEAINSLHSINRLVSIAETEFTARYEPNILRPFRLIFVLKRFPRQYRSINALYSSSNACCPYQKDTDAKPGNFQNNAPSEVENQWQEKYFQFFTPVRKIAKSGHQLSHGCSSVRPSIRKEQFAPNERGFIKFDSRVAYFSRICWENSSLTKTSQELRILYMKTYVRG